MAPPTRVSLALNPGYATTRTRCTVPRPREALARAILNPRSQPDRRRPRQAGGGKSGLRRAGCWV